ncbi:hypothetical protein ILYODFUR_016385 [Ilyodon furcidens]|uniref:Uncharacterized protein n=1 Tax=Ilyodon furcidens TaxID=33524 RepID=A0ABV0TXZ8_9TELE
MPSPSMYPLRSPNHLTVYICPGSHTHKKHPQYTHTLLLPSSFILGFIVAQAPLLEALSAFRGEPGIGAEGAVVFVVVGGAVCNSVSINEREGAVRGRSSSTGPGRHDPKAALLGAGEASEEVTQTVKLSCWDCCVVGGCW